MSRPRRILVIVVGFCLLSLAATYPLLTRLGSHYPGQADGDARHYLWNYWWVDQAVTESHRNPLETDRIFHPIGIGLSVHTLGLAQGLGQIPLRHTLGPTFAVNLWMLWTFVGSGLFTYGLARRLDLSPAVAFYCGVVFAFCPYRLARLAGHYDLLGTEWIALYAWMLVAAFEFIDGSSLKRRLYLLAAATSAALCGYTSLTYLLFLAMFTAIFLVYKIWVAPAKRRNTILRAAALLFSVAAMMSPLFLQIAEDASWTYPPYLGAERFSADALAYVFPGPTQRLGQPVARVWDANPTETTVFIGWTVLALMIVAATRGSIRRRYGFWWWAVIVFGLLSLGPTLRLAGTDTGIPLPFSLLHLFPGLEHLRAPSRFSIIVVLGAAILAGAGLEFCLARLRSNLNRIFALGIASLVVFAEFWTGPIPTFSSRVDPTYHVIRQEEPGLVLEIPGIEQQSATTMYHQTIHGQPILVGSTARVPREKLDYFLGLHLIRPMIDLRKGKLSFNEELVRGEKQWAPRVARFVDLGYLVFDRAYDRRGVRAFAEAVLPLTVMSEEEDRITYRVERNALPPHPRTLNASDPISRQHYAVGWLPAREDNDEGASRWASRKRADILFRWPQGTTGTVEIEIAPSDDFTEDEPLRIRARLNGQWLERELELERGWQRIRLRVGNDVERGELGRLELAFSELRAERLASGSTRNVAARVRTVRLVP